MDTLRTLFCNLLCLCGRHCWSEWFIAEKLGVRFQFRYCKREDCEWGEVIELLAREG